MVEQIFGDLIQFASHCKANSKIRSGCLQLFFFSILLYISKKILALSSLFCLFRWRYRTSYLSLVTFVRFLSAYVSKLPRFFWSLHPSFNGHDRTVSLYGVASRSRRVLLRSISGYWSRRWMGIAKNDLSRANYTTWVPCMMKWIDY